MPIWRMSCQMIKTIWGLPFRVHLYVVFQLLIYFRVGGWDSHWIMFIPLPHHTHTEILDGKRIPISVLHVLWVLHNQPMSVLSGLMEGSSLHVCLLLGSC